MSQIESGDQANPSLEVLVSLERALGQPQVRLLAPPSRPEQVAEGAIEDYLRTHPELQPTEDEASILREVLSVLYELVFQPLAVSSLLDSVRRNAEGDPNLLPAASVMSLLRSLVRDDRTGAHWFFTAAVQAAEELEATSIGNQSDPAQLVPLLERARAVRRLVHTAELICAKHMPSQIRGLEKMLNDLDRWIRKAERAASRR